MARSTYRSLAAPTLPPQVAVEVRPERFDGQVKAGEALLDAGGERRGGFAGPVGEEDARVLRIHGAFQAAADEQFHPFRCVGRVGEDQVGAAADRGRQADPQVSEVAADVPTEPGRRGVDGSTCLVDVHHDRFRVRVDQGQRERSEVVVADAEQPGAVGGEPGGEEQGAAERGAGRGGHVVQVGAGRGRCFDQSAEFRFDVGVGVDEVAHRVGEPGAVREAGVPGRVVEPDPVAVAFEPVSTAAVSTTTRWATAVARTRSRVVHQRPSESAARTRWPRAACTPCAASRACGVVESLIGMRLTRFPRLDRCLPRPSRCPRRAPRPSRRLRQAPRPPPCPRPAPGRPQCLRLGFPRSSCVR